MDLDAKHQGIHRAKIVLTILLLLPSVLAFFVFAFGRFNPADVFVTMRPPLLTMTILAGAGVVLAFWSKPLLVRVYGGVLALHAIPAMFQWESFVQDSSNPGRDLWGLVVAMVVFPAIISGILGTVRWVIAGFSTRNAS